MAVNIQMPYTILYALIKFKKYKCRAYFISEKSATSLMGFDPQTSRIVTHHSNTVWKGGYEPTTVPITLGRGSSHYNKNWQIWITKIYSLVVEAILINKSYTVKPAHVVTSIKQSSVLKDHLFSCPVIENFIWIEHFFFLSKVTS
jgi:hypothetical protein